jgi:hypothetical protein
MERKDEQQSGERTVIQENHACAQRDWERSEWFRRWLELIRGRKPQGVAR